MRPTTILSLLAGFLIALVAVAIGVYLYINRERNYVWFFWLAPVLVLSFGFMMLNLCRQYWARVGQARSEGPPASRG